jgi:hypothetical protein
MIEVKTMNNAAPLLQTIRYYGGGWDPGWGGGVGVSYGYAPGWGWDR